MRENISKLKSWYITILLLTVIFLCEPTTYITIPMLQPFYDMLKDAAIIYCILMSIIFYLYHKIENTYLKRHLVIYGFYYIFLVGESLIKYESIMAYPHIILVLSSFFFLIIFYVFLSKKLDPTIFLERLCYFTCGFIYLQQILARASIIPYAIDLAAIQRVAHVMTIFLLLFCTMYFISKYVQKPSFYTLLLIGINLFIIVIENHRSVWVSTILALLVFTYMIVKVKKESIKIIYFLLIALMIFIISVSLFAFAEAKYIDFMKERFSEIYKFKEMRGTGMFRLVQYEYYLSYIKENLLFGLRFRGFELPGVYDYMYEKMSGHHFHSGYLTILFYHGLFGFYLFYGPIIYYIFRFLRQKNFYTQDVALFSFIVSGLALSFAYELWFFYFAALGIGFVFLEKKRESINK